jgi:hypothetical protein
MHTQLPAHDRQIDRHNRLARCIRRSIENLIPTSIVGQIHENTPIQIDGLSEACRKLKPDIWFYRKEDEA